MAKPTDKKPRIERIQGVTAGMVTRITVTYDTSEGTIRIPEVEPNSLTVSRSYNRESGKEKITTTIKPNREGVSFDTWPELKASYDYLLAVDTNTRESHGLKISVTVAYAVPERLSELTSEVHFVPLCGYVAVNVKPPVNPETLGWHFILENHLGRALENKGRVGVVVDSELERLPSINSRVTPYYDTHFLPHNVNLIYASDATADQLPNQMIRYCDKAATDAMCEILKKPEQLRGLTSDNPSCEGYSWFKTRSA